MRTSCSSDGLCPLCEEQLESRSFLWGSDLDGNRGIWITELDDCSCGWEHGDEVTVCDDCEGVIAEGEDVKYTEDGELCVECYFGRMVPIQKMAKEERN